MAKAQSPLLGYNTNVRHKGRIFHIQTEDSGIARPHVLTHIFADGGRVLKSAKTSYADILEAPDLPVLVKKLMQEQHKSMFVALRDGQFDGQFEPVEEPATTRMSALQEPPEELAASALILDDQSPIEIDESQFIESGDSFPTVPPPAPPEPIQVTPPPVPTLAKQSGPWVTAPQARASLTPVNIPAAMSSSKPPPLRSSPVRAPPPHPPPRTVTGSAARVATSPSVRATAPSVPHAAASAPRQGPMFGERMVSERSLDEVILAYLAEELDDTLPR